MTGRTTPRPDAPRRFPHLRAARSRLHLPPRRGTSAPGTFAGLVEKIPTCSDLASRPSNCCRSRIDENDCPFDTRTPARNSATSGATTRSPRRRRPPTPPRPRTRPGGRVPDMVKAFHAAGPGSVSRRGLHHTRRGRRPRPHLLLRGRTTNCIPARFAGPLPNFHRLRQHAQLHHPVGATC